MFGEKIVSADEFLKILRMADWTDEGLILDYEVRDGVVLVKRLGGATSQNMLKK